MAAEAGTRYRLVTDQDGSRYTSAVVLSRDEADEQLVLEAVLHHAKGWSVAVLDGGLVCVSPKGVVRRIHAHGFGPLDDVEAPSSNGASA